MLRFPKPCLDCGQLTDGGSRCQVHQEARDARRTAVRTAKTKERKKDYYDADYRKRAKAIRDTAVACHICGDGFRFDDPFQADHVIPGDRTLLAPAHRSCNARKGDRSPIAPPGTT